MHEAVIIIARLSARIVLAGFLRVALGLSGHHGVAGFALALGRGVPTKPFKGEGRGKLMTHGELPLRDIYLA
ncbi:MAG TPA: hypothetical protein VLT37_02500 [Acidocella sp.]|nr:hypothetical protein [Acidocella sp.]